jgi:hypothetical protein
MMELVVETIWTEQKDLSLSPPLTGRRRTQQKENSTSPGEEKQLILMT